jgi:hypothetical protein
MMFKREIANMEELLQLSSSSLIDVDQKGACAEKRNVQARSDTPPSNDIKSSAWILESAISPHLETTTSIHLSQCRASLDSKSAFLRLPSEVLFIIITHVTDYHTLMSLAAVSPTLHKIISDPRVDALIFKSMLNRVNPDVDLSILDTIPSEDLNGFNSQPWRQACVAYLKMEKNLKHGLKVYKHQGNDPHVAVKNRIPNTFAPVTSFSSIMTHSSLTNGFIYSKTTIRDLEGNFVDHAVIRFDFEKQSYRVIPAGSIDRSAESLIYNDPTLPSDQRWDFSYLDHPRILAQIDNSTFVLAGVIDNKTIVSAKTHEKELWRVQVPAFGSLAATKKYVVDIALFPSFRLFDIKTGKHIVSGTLPFPKNGVATTMETHLIVCHEQRLYAITWENLIEACQDLERLDNLVARREGGLVLSNRKDDLVNISWWTLFADLDEFFVERNSIHKDFTFFGDSFGHRFIALEHFSFEYMRCYLIDLYKGTLTKYVMPSLKPEENLNEKCRFLRSYAKKPGLSEPRARMPGPEMDIDHNWTEPMKQSLLADDPNILATFYNDSRQAVYCWMVDAYGRAVFLSAMVLTQLGRLFIQKDRDKEESFSTYLKM